MFGTTLAEGKLRVISWQTRSPVMDIVIQRMPQTLWVVGMAYVVGILIALPIGIYLGLQAIFGLRPGRHLRHDDRLFGAALLFRRAGDRDLRGQLGWFPSIYDTTHEVVDWDSFVQLQQMIMPVMVLALQITAQISRFMRASMLDNLNQDYVRTARAKGLSERSWCWSTCCATR
jgi:peptide/nickel transport system permease protein